MAKKITKSQLETLEQQRVQVQTELYARTATRTSPNRIAKSALRTQNRD